MSKYLSELVGTFMLVLVGAGSITISLPHFWIAFSFGAIVTLMILVFGKRSGAHINPAVSLGFYIVARDKTHLRYITYQLAGGLLAGIVLYLVFPSNITYGETTGSGSLIQTFTIEVGITFTLMLSIFLIARTNKIPLIAVIVGLVVFLAAYYAGPYTGASMNPARSLGPNVVSGDYNLLWLYFLAPFLGAALAAQLNKFLFPATK